MSTPMVAWVSVLLAALALALVAVVPPTPAYAATTPAAPMVSEQDFQDTCFTEDGEFEPTDGCYKSAEDLGIEIDNLNESMDKGCKLANLFEDYSCISPQHKGYELISEEESSDSSSSSLVLV